MTDTKSNQNQPPKKKTHRGKKQVEASDDRGVPGFKSDLYQQVADRFTEEMRLMSYSVQQLQNAESLWWDFVRRSLPTIRKPAAFAASVEYAVARLDFVEEVTQADVATRYGTSVASVGRIFGLLKSALDLEVFDSRYSSVESPFSDMMVTPDGLLVPRSYLSDGQPEQDFDSVEQAPVESMAFKIVLPDQLDRDSLSLIEALPSVEEEWQGGMRWSQIVIEKPFPVHPLLSVWTNPSDGMVLSLNAWPPVHGIPFLATLLAAMVRPAVGEPRRPTRIRVENRSLAQKLAQLMAPLHIEVIEGDCPFVDMVVEQFHESLSRTQIESSYLDGGRIPSALVGQFFRAAANLIRVSPWSYVDDDQVLELDLGWEGARTLCVSIIGAAGFERGLLVFESPQAFLTYSDRALIADEQHRGLSEPGATITALNYSSGKELDAEVRKEIIANGWEVENPESFPILIKVSEENAPIRCTPEDYRIAIVCAEGVGSFVEKHVRLFRQRRPEPVREQIPISLGGESLVVTITNRSDLWD